MRRAIAAAVAGGLVLGGAVATPSIAATRGTGMKNVVYQGYEFQVPASWPVYRLDEHPQTCVRYDVHAVYLGTPGADMRCPAGLVGRTQTVSFIPGQSGATVASGEPATSAGADGTELQRLPAVHGEILQEAVQHQLRVDLGSQAAGAPNATVVGTYGTDPGVIEQVLNTLHAAPVGAASTAQSASTSAQPGGTTRQSVQRARLSAEPAAQSKVGTVAQAATAPRPGGATSAAVAPASRASAPVPTYTTWRGVPPNWPVEIVQPTPPAKPKPTPPVNGFDTCTAPSVATMRAWRSAFGAVGAYIGGANAACAGGNLSASWMKSVAGMGWGVLPTYVGPQAPCWGYNGVLISPGRAAAEGKAAGTDAVGDAHSLHLPAGSPVYYDMEAYNGGSSCTSAVLAFLGAWDAQVAAAGYVSGVYSSQDSGIVDLQAAAASKRAGFTTPDALWIARWDNNRTLADGTLAWPLSDRNKQYSGNDNVTVGGVTLNIDKDYVGGPLAR